MIQISKSASLLLLFVLLVVNASLLLAANDPITLSNGRYQLFHFKNEKDAQYSFVLNLPKFHKEQVSVFAAPFGCNSPINIYASVDKIPSSSSHEFAHKGSVGETAFLFANLTQQGTPKTEKFYIVVQSAGEPGQLCSVNFMAYARHTQHLIVLENAVPQWGGFPVDHSPETPHIHWYEFDLGKDVDPDNLGLAFYITSIEGQVAQEHYTFNAYVANNNARPTPQNHQWASLTLSDGDAFVQVTKADIRYKPAGKYYVGVQLVENPRLMKSAAAADKTWIHFTITAQIIKKERQLKPILLFNDQPQIGVSSEVEHKASFLAYVDPEIVSRNVQLVPTVRTGAIQIYVSSTTSHPSKDHFEFQGDGSHPITMSFSHPTFVYITVETYKGVISAYDLEFKRQ